MHLLRAEIVWIIAATMMSAATSPDQDSAHMPVSQHTNRLADETSPYLLQHRSNPVDWYPWGEEAFTAAREQDKPIFLSVGYSTCYWCHVMERESFEDEDVAAVMNELFICIKVDREERPDVDDIYMDAVRLLSNGRGGWPMSVWMEPEGLRPFAGGTYFPKEQFVDFMKRLSAAWTANHDQVLNAAEQIADRVKIMNQQRGGSTALSAADVDEAAAMLAAEYDRTHAGFGTSPKFPTPPYLDFLIGAGWDNSTYRDIITQTLDRMATGGIYDQIGGGFHRYSTDRQWLVPHFEKMLYDNGQLVSTYARVYELTDDPFYAEIVRETLDYVIREMTDERGGFWSAQDAEVDAREGKNYLWTREQVREVLATAALAGDIDFAVEVYGFDQGTNFQDPHHPHEDRSNVVFLKVRPDAFAKSMDLTLAEFNERVDRINTALYAHRITRKQPGTDDKVLAGWNGLMIAGMADGGRVLGDDRYIKHAREAAEFVLQNMRSGDRGLLRTYRAGTSKIEAFLEDYALFVHGLLALHRATDDANYLEESIRLMDHARSLFWDDEHGGWFDTQADQSDLFIRTKSTYDGAVPSGNSVMLNNLVTLIERTGDARYRDDLIRGLRSMSETIAQRPVASILSTLAYHRSLALEVGLEFSPSGATDTRGRPNPVTVSPVHQTIRLAADRPVAIELTLEIADQYHINAHEPGIDFLIPLSIAVVGSDQVEAAVAYPKPEQYQGPIADGVIHVHHGRIAMPITLTTTTSDLDQVQLAVTWQACTERACLAPETKIITLQIADE